MNIIETDLNKKISIFIDSNIFLNAIKLSEKDFSKF